MEVSGGRHVNTMSIPTASRENSSLAIPAISETHISDRNLQRALWTSAQVVDALGVGSTISGRNGRRVGWCSGEKQIFV